MIKEKWKKWTKKRENGSVIVESCIVFPVVFFVIAFIIYLGNAYFQTAQVDDCVERAAIKGAQCIINPQQYDTVNNGKVPLSIQNVEPYRYIFGELPGASISEIETKIGEDCIKDIEQKTFSFFNNMTPRLNDSRKVAEFNNYVLYSTFQVQVSYEIHFPIRFIFLDDPVVMKFQSRAEVPVNDTPEFIRNVDLVVDLFHGTERAHKITDSFTKVRSFIDNFGGFGGGSGGTSGGPGDTNGIVSGGGTGGGESPSPSPADVSTPTLPPTLPPTPTPGGGVESPPVVIGPSDSAIPEDTETPGKTNIKKLEQETKTGTVNKNKLSKEEYNQAQEVVGLKGGHFEGQTESNTPGIDGYLNGTPVSLKEYSGKSVSGVLKHASKAEAQVKNAGLKNVDLYINAKSVSRDALIDFANNGPLANIPGQGYIDNIYIQTADGWILIH